MSDTSKQTQPEPKEPKQTEAALDEKQLDKVTGGTASSTLYNACATGKHIPTGVITG
jgi:hypothetical protein